MPCPLPTKRGSTLGVGGELAQWPIGHTHLSSEWVSVARGWLSGGVSTATGMSTIGAMTTDGDLRHFERMQRVSEPARRPAGILFADLEGSTLYVGNIITAGRTEVTALGDEVNEAARIEACATGGRALASKSLLERLGPTDAARLGLDPDHATYTRLADLATATDKARRDAPAIAVHDI